MLIENNIIKLIKYFLALNDASDKLKIKIKLILLINKKAN